MTKYRVETWFNHRYTWITEHNNLERAIIQSQKSYNRKHGPTRVIKITEEIIHKELKLKWK